MIDNEIYWNKIPLLEKYFSKKLLENRERILKIFH